MTEAADRVMSGDVFAGLLGVWTAAELDQALPERPRGEVARWPMLGIFLLLWQWAFENRVRTFERVLPILWPVTRMIVRRYHKTMAPDPVSPVALFKGRKALGCESLRSLWSIANAKALARFDTLSRTLGLRVQALDGSWLNLPHAHALADEFGRPSAEGQKKPMPQMLMVTMNLVNLGWFTDVRLGRYDDSELRLAQEMTATLGRDDLLLCDRLFFDTVWMSDLVGRGVELLFRATEQRVLSFTAEAIAEVQRQRNLGGTVDCEVAVKVATNHHGKPASLLRLRYVEIAIAGEILRFLTTLSQARLGAEAVAELYLLRWGIETDYRLFKGADHLPVVLSRTPATVHQEIILRILAHNSVRFVQAEACLLKEASPPVATSVFPLRRRRGA
jgi:hypothetical protein